MMSVPAINPVLPSSGNQSSKVTSSPATSSVTPIGLTVPQKMPVITSQISTSPNKPSVNINHSPGPLSLVHENKIIGVQTQATTAKPSDKPKDLSPAKPTSNGIESSTKASPTQVLPVQGCANAAIKDESPAEQLIANHATNDATKQEDPEVDTPEEEAKASQPQNSSDDSQSVNQSDSGSITEAKVNTDATLHSSESGTEVKSGKSDVKATSGPNKRKREQKTEDKKGDEPIPEKKPQRIRSQVLPYQSPFPELTTFIHKSLKEKDAPHKSSDEKLIVFYKNEFLAVRNAENGFYLCQTLQNVYRTSHRIRIRWLSQDKESNTIYTPDFYDFTDFECILTTVALEKINKNKYKLPEVELERTENILKRALDVEKGVSEKPCVTEEHPDGIDLSLYKDESQLQKPKKRKSALPSKKSPKQPKKSEKDDGQKGEQEEGKDESEEVETTAGELKKKKKKAKSGAKTTKPKAAKCIFTYKMRFVSKLIFWLRVIFTMINITCFILVFAPIGKAMEKYKGKNVLTWSPKDGGHDLHLISTISEWILVLSFCLYISTFYWEFKRFQVVSNNIKFYGIEEDEEVVSDVQEPIRTVASRWL